MACFGTPIKKRCSADTSLSPERVALKYKELWQVEQVFREVKSILETRPVFHKSDEAIRGHIFYSFLTLVLKRELDRCLVKRRVTVSNGRISNKT